MAKIHEQQADLEILQVEYPLIDTLKEDIEPHRKLCDLQVEYDSKYTNLWNQGALKTLNPDDLESDFRRMFSIANNLVSKFSEKKSCEKNGKKSNKNNQRKTCIKKAVAKKVAAKKST